MSIDLIKEFSTDPHPPLKKFYMDRLISDKKIANWLGVSSMTVGRWFKDTIPDKYKPQMEELYQEILEWEKQNGMIFNGGSVLIDNTDPPEDLICPYSNKVDIVIGRDFYDYKECENCDLRFKCLELHDKFKV
jgi:hypothetical protein